MTHADLICGLQRFQAICCPKTEAERAELGTQLQRLAHIAKLWQHRCESVSKVSWLTVYALGIRWIPGWFTKIERLQMLWLALFSLLNWKIAERGMWYREVELCLKEGMHALEHPSDRTWTWSHQLGELL